MKPPGLKFSGRTPSRTIGGEPLRADTRAARKRFLRQFAAVCLLLMPVVALLRGVVGSSLPFARSLQLVQLEPLPNFAPRAANTALVAGHSGFWDTLLGPVWFYGEMAQALGPRGLLSYVPVILLTLGLWYLLAVARGWRRPPVAFLLLISLQVFGAAYWLVSFRAPARTLRSPYTAFDFHAHTTHSSGLLSPQQQVNWHRARGFHGLAFTDSDRIMDANEFAALRARNPDMILLNGEEYRGDKHILFFGLKSPIRSRNFSVSAALAEATKQGAVIVAPHPWSPDQAPRAPEFLAAGALAVEAWNGVVFDRPSLEAARAARAPALASTDTASKSGAVCNTWTLLPRGLNEAKVLRALRLKKTAVATTLTDADSSEAYDRNQRAQRKPLATFRSMGTAWHTLSTAQRICTLLLILAKISLLWGWGARGPRREVQLSGPSRVVGFLKRRRLAVRGPALLLMLFAWAGSILAAVYCLSWTQKFVPGIGPVHAVLGWLVCDAVFWWGRGLWHRAG